MKQKVHIIGSGWGCVGFLKHIDNEKFEIHVISNSSKFIYTPLLANNIYKNYNLEVDIKEINNQIKFSHDKIIDINQKENEIISENNKYKYENLIFSHGATINTFNINGVSENCFFIKSQEESNKIKANLNKLNNGDKIVVIGTNLTGAELVGNLIDYKKFNITAVDGLKSPLPSFNQKISNFVLNLWKDNQVNCLYGNFVTKMDSKKIYFDNNHINYDMAIWCGGLKKSSLTEIVNKKLNLDCRFGIPITPYLNIKGYNNLFAIGDCSFSGYPPTAQLAYQQGKYLALNFNKNFDKMKEFEFQNKGQICYVGNNKSVFQNKYFELSGFPTFVLNKFIHIYNGINLKQRLEIIFGKKD